MFDLCNDLRESGNTTPSRTKWLVERKELNTFLSHISFTYALNEHNYPDSGIALSILRQHAGVWPSRLSCFNVSASVDQDLNFWLQVKWCVSLSFSSLFKTASELIKLIYIKQSIFLHKLGSLWSDGVLGGVVGPT